MNVLLVNLGDSTEGRSEWARMLGKRDGLFVLRCGHSQLSASYQIHDLEQILVSTEYRRWPKKVLEILFDNLRRVRRLCGSKMQAFALWNMIVNLHWKDFVGDVRSLDPDIIDLRYVPNCHTLASKLSTAFPRASVLSEVRIERPNVSWRKYDAKVKVSIVLPVYNGEKFLRQSIESCLNQTHQNIELVIVDDCSTDSTAEIIREYAKRDRRIVSIRNSSNLHLPRTLNEGFRNTTGRLLTWTSDDNCYALDAIEFLVAQLCSRPEIDLAYTAFYQINELGKVDPRVIYPPDPKYIALVNVVGPCFMYRRVVYEKTGEYRVDMEYQEDYEYCLRASLAHFRMMRFHKPLYFYRRHEKQISARRMRDPTLVKVPINVEYARMRQKRKPN